MNNLYRPFRFSRTGLKGLKPSPTLSINPIISGWMAGRTRSEAEEALNAHGVPVGPVHTASEVFACPQVEARKMLISVDDPVVGEYRFARTVPMLSSAPAAEGRPAPRLGEHTRQILGELLGYDAAEIDRLEREKIVESAY